MNLKTITIVLGSILSFTMISCNSNKINNHEQTENSISSSKLISSLKATQNNYNIKDTITLEFTVTNPTSKVIKFTKYHTPFEGMISDFLTIKDTKGNDIKYIGPMVKRVTPPPSNSYHTLEPGASESIKFSINKSYKIENAGTYIINYIQTPINGIKTSKSIKIKVNN